MNYRQRTSAELIARAKEILASHSYTLIATGPHAEIWQCAKNGSSTYGFTISVTRFGIAMVGDLKNLTFRVGSSYGLPFLAGSDIDYYIHSKLDAHCQAVEFDHDALKQAVCDSVCELICEEYLDEDEKLPPGTPDWVSDERARQGKFGDLKAWIEGELAEAGEDVRWIRLAYPLREIARAESAEQAKGIMEEHQDGLGLGPDWWEICITKPCGRLMQTLYVLNEAAKAIMAIKTQAITGDEAAAESEQASTAG